MREAVEKSAVLITAAITAVSNRPATKGWKKDVEVIKYTRSGSAVTCSSKSRSARAGTATTPNSKPKPNIKATQDTPIFRLLDICSSRSTANQTGQYPLRAELPPSPTQPL